MIHQEIEKPRAVIVAFDASYPTGCRPGEIEELARTAGYAVAGVVESRDQKIDSRYYLTRGKVEYLRSLLPTGDNPGLLIIDRQISATQQRNLEKALCCTVLDRVELILKIFAQRARSYEGKLQVELAQLQHLSTRLVRGWSHLERQRGGIGLRGPGETQLETDRRLIGKRITVVKNKLEKVIRQRGLGRSERKRQGMRTVALVGYTNSGKSTLFNRLCNTDSFAENLLFATLDPTIRKWPIQAVSDLVVADTVGFIRDLPPQLVAAFRGTLEEVTSADLILHVVDLEDERRAEAMEEVRDVLRSLDAERIPRITVFNKIDAKGWPPRSDHTEAGSQVWVSAQTGQGLHLLSSLVEDFFTQQKTKARYHFRDCKPALRAWLYQHKAILTEEFREDGSWAFECAISQRMAGQLRNRIDDVSLQG